MRVWCDRYAVQSREGEREREREEREREREREREERERENIVNTFYIIVHLSALKVEEIVCLVH